MPGSEHDTWCSVKERTKGRKEEKKGGRKGGRKGRKEGEKRKKRLRNEEEAEGQSVQRGKAACEHVQRLRSQGKQVCLIQKVIRY